VIQALKLEPQIMRYELTDLEWSAIKPFLPNKPRGVPRVNDRRILRCKNVSEYPRAANRPAPGDKYR
jgi:hypothetical protein